MLGEDTLRGSNKILKGYLRHRQPTTLEETGTVVVSAIRDYGEVRPHGTLWGATPMERYLDPSFRPALPDLRAAREQRIAENRSMNCRLTEKGGDCPSESKPGAA